MALLTRLGGLAAAASSVWLVGGVAIRSLGRIASARFENIQPDAGLILSEIAIAVALALIIANASRVLLSARGGFQSSWLGSVLGASKLVSGDTNKKEDVFVRDRQTGTPTRVSVSSSGVQGAGVSGDPAITVDGRYVAFISDANALVPNDTNRKADVFVRDRQTGTTSRVSVASDASQGNAGSEQPAISGDGRYVAFASFSTSDGRRDRLPACLAIHGRCTHRGRYQPHAAVDLPPRGLRWSTPAAHRPAHRRIL